MRQLMRNFLTFILAIIAGTSYGQGFSYPLIQSKGKTINDFAPVGWTVLDSAYGDLNKDGLNDAAVILQHKDSITILNGEDDSVLTQPRILLLLFKNAVDNEFQLAEQSHSFILKHDNSAMEDPYEGLTISKGIVEIKFHLFYNMGSWYVTNAVYKFRYQQGQFVLIGADNFSFHRASHDYEDYIYNFLTKKRILTKGNDNNNTKTSTSKAIPVPTLKTLKTFSEPFTWEVEKDIFL